MLRIQPSTASGMITYSKILGDRYTSRSIYSVVRKIVMADIKDGLIPNLAWERTYATGLSGNSHAINVYHLLTNPEEESENKILENTLMELKRKSYIGSENYDLIHDALLEVRYIRRNY